MAAKNIVTAGDYTGAAVMLKVNLTKRNDAYIIKPQNFLITLCKGFLAFCTLGISMLFFKTRKLWINKNTVAAYEVIGEESQVSATSAVARGAIGAALLGPVGMAAALSARKNGIYTISLQFMDGKRSLIEASDEVYKAIQQALY